MDNLENLLENNDLGDLYEAYEEGQTFDEFLEAAEIYISESDIIYCSAAMEYLSENDPSLNRSLSIAMELRYTISDIDSETLARLLLQESMMESLNSILNEIKECFYD